MPVVLIVDDNHFFLKMERLLFERHGFQVTTAEDGEEGYAVFQAHAARLDVVITDLMMPKLSGTDLCKRIKRVRRSLPVVLVTGVSGERGKVHPEFDLVLYKPLDPNFVDLVKGLIDDSKRKHGLTSAG